MTQPSGGPSSGRRLASARRWKQEAIEEVQEDERSAMADLTPWQQALLYANRANPYPLYAELRKTPVSRQPDGSYVVSTYHEIVSILHDPRVSSDLRKRPKVDVAEARAPPTAFDHEPSMITSDPPEHDRVRRAAMLHFGPPNSPDLVA